MEFLVEFEVDVPEHTPEGEVRQREAAEAAAAARLVDEGHLLRVWKRPVGLREWMHVAVTPLQPHPNDPGRGLGDPSPTREASPTSDLPDPRLTRVYHLEATLGQALDLGDIAQGHRRIVPLTGGSFTGPEMHGQLLAGTSADWQILLPDGTALGDIRYVLQTERGDLLYVQSRGVRHGSSDVLARPRTRRTRRRLRVHLPHVDPDRDRRTRSGLDEQRHLHQRRRPPGRGRDLRHLSSSDELDS